MFVFLQGNRRALPLCVMLLIMQAFGEGQVGYDASARGEAYSHTTTINQALTDKPSVPSVCFVITGKCGVWHWRRSEGPASPCRPGCTEKRRRDSLRKTPPTW